MSLNSRLIKQLTGSSVVLEFNVQCTDKDLQDTVRKGNLQRKLCIIAANTEQLLLKECIHSTPTLTEQCTAITPFHTRGNGGTKRSLAQGRIASRMVWA